MTDLIPWLAILGAGFILSFVGKYLQWVEKKKRRADKQLVPIDPHPSTVSIQTYSFPQNELAPYRGKQQKSQTESQYKNNN